MIILRITGDLYSDVVSDLRRPHPHASERVGFLSAEHVTLPNGTVILLCAGYHPVDDLNYIEDPLSGARINSTAIRQAMQLGLDTGRSIFHIHAHLGRGMPSFGVMDKREIPPIVESLHNINPASYPGMIVINSTGAYGLIEHQNNLQPISRLAVIDYPLKFSHFI